MVPFLVVVMGVSGCGKSTVAARLAHSLGRRFVDADDFHPPENRDKMGRGIPLNDDDRRPWLETLNQISRERPLVLACSALKRDYRQMLSRDLDAVFVLLKVPREQLEQRLNSRTGHFMPASLLHSQLATLEVPKEVSDEEGNEKTAQEERAIIVDASRDENAVIDDVLHQVNNF